MVKRLPSFGCRQGLDEAPHNTIRFGAVRCDAVSAVGQLTQDTFLFVGLHSHCCLLDIMLHFSQQDRYDNSWYRVLKYLVVEGTLHSIDDAICV